MAERARSAAEKLKKEQKADLVIALTHIGLEEDKALARKVPQIDVICGSHSHDLLKTGQEVVLLRPDGSRTIIVQAGARGQYLGLLKLELENGLIMGHQWEPIRVGATIIQAPDMEDLIRMYQKKMPLKRVLTTSRVALDCLSETVRAREAAIGNLITDIIRQRFNTDMAFHNGGGIRGERVIPAGRITTEDIDTMLPFENRVVLLRLKGRVIKQALERGVAFLSPKQGAFLQVSGLRYEVNPKAAPQKLRTDKNRIPIGIRQPGSRIVNIEVLQKEGRYQPLDSERVYTVAVNSYLASGGDGYVMLKAARHRTNTYVPLRSAVINRLDRTSFIAPKQEDRIRIGD
jgi:2',3'-cyclic-nucleotide 2'-phosphodiesterase (5'-nucleotidase family)